VKKTQAAGQGEEAWKIYKQEVKERNLSRRFVQSMAELRATFDHAGAPQKVLVIVGDGSFCNRTVLSGIPDRVVLIARTRKDASLCFRAPEGDRRFYSKDKFTPDQVRLDETISWQTTKIFYGGKRRKVRYKEVTGRALAGRRAGKGPYACFLCLAGHAYRKRKSGKLYYRHPAFLLTTVPERSPGNCCKCTSTGGRSKVNHRDEKDTLGVVGADVEPVSVPKQPALVVASYSALLLAALKAFGPGRGEAYAALPRWRSNAKRPSCPRSLRPSAQRSPAESRITGKHSLSLSSSQMIAAAAA